MTSTERIKNAYERYAAIIADRPSAAMGTQTVKAVARDGLTIDVAAGDFRITVDEPEEVGGSGEGASPGDHCLAAVSACLAMAYVQHAARLGIPLANLSVEVEGDYDVRRTFGFDGPPPGFSEIRYAVTVETSADEADVLRMLDQAETGDFMLDVLNKPIATHRKLEVRRPDGG